ncbi:FMN-dependent NADH-azoreductase [Pseudochryseolinea flava]|uniref:FMN dependent NADH:quinone oxidoreductase n=1 Tax=Pseudochryseolinea flava TaxID=2059302 RepID=A0A364Y6Y0_9BACT|nr:NAD(P)H-dependent oxidoreductase [Pseudochryseolinea flava]RAW02864.1 FMN-dependent NADH-azoreductase [Pseudochryseolinea flava]
MKTLLRIDSSIRHIGSISRDLGDHFVSHWLKKFPGARVITRDLQSEQVPHLSQATVQAFFSGLDNDELALSNGLINELLACDDILITCPMYNFQIPSSLKSYLDHVVRVNKTFSYNDGQYMGLLRDKSSYLITTMGGKKDDITQDENFEHYLRGILAFIGLSNTNIFCADGTTNPEYLSQTLPLLKQRITKII